MADKYQESTFINLYPSALRGGNTVERDKVFNPESKIGTEANLISVINTLTIDGSFVISKVSNTVKFVIHGYQFETTLTDSFLNSIGSNDIYASIRLRELAQGSYNLWSLTTFDEQSTILDVEEVPNSDIYFFKGVVFTNAIKKGTNVYNLHLLTKEGTKWVVPEESLLKFNSSDVSIEGTPLATLLGKDTLTIDNGEFKKIESDEATITTLNATTINATKFVGNLEGIADNSKVLVDNSGNPITIGDGTSSPVVLKDGKPAKLAQTGDANTMTYVDNTGAVKAGMKIWASTSAPTDSQGKDGDFWFQYN